MNDFVRSSNLIYARYPYYAPDLDMYVRDTFTPPKKNMALNSSDIQLFIAYSNKREPIERVGIINHLANEK